MNKKFFVIISLVLTAIMLFSSCQVIVIDETTAEAVESTAEAPVNNEEKTTTAEAKEEDTTKASETTPTEAPENTSVNTPDNTTEAATDSVTEAAPTETQTQENTAPAAPVTGYTLKGFPITEKDGITYVDGVLIANKTYSLPENYNPGDLLDECADAFAEMKSAAAAEGLNIWNASGFRSYELQRSLYNRYSDRDGKDAADRYSARPGHSEHQTGLAIDLNEITNAFKDTAEGKWVAENCHRYGFILRYPEGKEAQTGYMYEPWHIRYVGIDTATSIYESGLCLEEYYGITSSYDPVVVG